MPRLDNTGSMGQGAQTGRKMGRCSSDNELLTTEQPNRRGYRKGRGLGLRMRHGNGWESPGDGNNFGRRQGRRNK